MRELQFREINSEESCWQKMAALCGQWGKRPKEELTMRVGKHDFQGRGKDKFAFNRWSGKLHREHWTTCGNHCTESLCVAVARSNKPRMLQL